MNQVIVGKDSNPFHNTLAVMRQLKLPDLTNKRILLKPNTARLAPAGSGIVTHPDVIAALIDFFRETFDCELAVGEGSILGIDVMEAFKISGVMEIAKLCHVSLLDLDSFEPLILPIPDSKLITEIKVSSIYKDFDFIVSVPVMKTHMHTGVSLSIKNMKGFLHRREKVKLHHLHSSPEDPVKSLERGIADMASVLKPHLAVIDGSVAMEGLGPSAGDARTVNLIIAGSDFVATDLIAARLMGFDPLSFDYLKLAFEQLHPNCTIDDIPIQPADYLKYKENFKSSPQSIDMNFPNVMLHEYDSCSACLSSLFVFLKAFHEKIAFENLNDGKLHFYIGKNVESVDYPGALLIGNCTADCRKKGIFIPGCPPISSRIFEKMKKLKLIHGEFEQNN